MIEKVAMTFCESVKSEKYLWNKLKKIVVVDAGYSKVWSEKREGRTLYLPNIHNGQNPVYKCKVGSVSDDI